MNDQESSNDNSSSKNSSISRSGGAGLKGGGTCETGPKSDGGPPGGPLEADCISISSDSDSSQHPPTRSSRCSSIPQAIVTSSSNTSSSSSSKEGGRGEAHVCVLVDSDEDSDYKHDVLALLDSDGETAEGGLPKPQQQSAIINSSSNSSSSSSRSGDVSGAAEVEFPCIYDLFASYNSRFFGGRLSHVEVKWSSRMTLCAGLCVYRVSSPHLR
ncbi:hypothetical protein ACSSS7_007016 [Eimeria intestinalis]